MFVLDAGGPRRLLLLAATVVVALIAAACGPGAQATSVPASASPSASAAGPLNLDGTSWRLSDYISPDGAHFTVPAAVTPLAEFKDGMMTGHSGCNTFSTTYTVEGDAIKLGPIVSTKMACAEPMASVENAYLAALGTVDKVAILDDGKLQLWDTAGKTTLAFLQGS